MKLATYVKDGVCRSGVIRGDLIHDLGPRSLQNWFGRAGEIETMIAGHDGQPFSLNELCQPILRPGKILGIGLNYHDHASETGRAPPEVQLWFNKQTTAAHAPFAPVALPEVSSELDYEAELVVIIGKYGRHVPASRAMEMVAGYTCGNDYSVRDWQKASPTMIMGKGFDTHAPFGPWIVTPDEMGTIEDAGVRCYVNGEQRQNGRAGDMVFSVAEQIAHLTKAFTLEPGDVIFTGTPAGVGVAYSPPQFLQAGDVVRVEIDGIGAIEQKVIVESGDIRISE